LREKISEWNCVCSAVGLVRRYDQVLRFYLYTLFGCNFHLDFGSLRHDRVYDCRSNRHLRTFHLGHHRIQRLIPVGSVSRTGSDVAGRYPLFVRSITSCKAARGVIQMSPSRWCTLACTKLGQTYLRPCLHYIYGKLKPTCIQ
jgi:hypothetical protein